MKKILTVLAVIGLLALAVPAQGVTIWKLTLEEQASLGANWAIQFTHADLTTATTNTAQSFTNTFAVLAKQSVRFIGMELNTAFTDADTNYTGSTLLYVGDGADVDYYLTSTELNSAGTEVWRKFAPLDAGTIACTMQTTLIYPTGTTNAGPPVVTNVTAAFTAAALGTKVYTADDYIDFVFTPSAEEGLDDLTAGAVTLYFDIQTSK